MIEYAQKNLKSLENVHLAELKDVSLKDFQNNSIDKVYCSTVFMHLDEWDRYTYVEEALRVLKPGGKAYFDNINLLGDIGWSIFKEMRLYDPANRPTNISKTSTPEELSNYLERAGFINIQSFPGSHYVAVSGSKKVNS
jgi:SAM-dependent methyltransferase